MAIDVNNARFLLGLKKNGIDFKDVATIGRQGLFIPPRLVKSLFEQFHIQPARVDESFYSKESVDFSEPFFEALGTEDLKTIDYSDYEGADIVQDMNQPVPASLKNRFDILIDSGSIEHMFHFPQAIKNYMDMVKLGGHVILVNMPVNNHMGHGFYQFSPELFYNLFTENNGFEMSKVWVAEDFPYADFYEVINPKKVEQRICLCNDQPVLLFMVARKIKEVASLTYPIQNDYAKSWSSGAVYSFTAGRGGVVKMLRSAFTKWNHKAYFKFSVRRNWNLKKKKYELFNSEFYKKVNE